MWPNWLLGELLNKNISYAVKDSRRQEKFAKLILALILVNKIVECQCNVLDERGVRILV